MAKKLHVVITPANWDRMREYIEAYNADPVRVTPKFKPADVVNLALHAFLTKRKD